MGASPQSFGVELRRRRSEAGISLGALAKLVHYSKGYLSRVESGEKPASADVARRCDSALGAGGALAALVPRRPPGDSTAPAATADTGPWGLRLAADGSVDFQVLGRPDALTADTAALSSVGAAPQSMAAVAAEATTSALLAGTLSELRRLGQHCPPAVLLPTLIVQVHTIRALAAAGPARPGLLVLAARFAEYTGWMFQESGDERAAAWWTDQAVQYATAAGDLELAAYALVRRANAALYRDDAVATIALARQAQADRRIGPRVRRLAAQREAQGHALAGDRDECLRCLDRAQQLLGRAEETKAGFVLGMSSVPDPGGLVLGWCLYDLGRAEEAVAVLERELAGVPAAARRTRARFASRLALAQAACGDPEGACTTAGHALDDVELVHSATIRTDLRLLARSLTRWHRRPPVLQLSPRLTAALHVLS